MSSNRVRAAKEGIRLAEEGLEVLKAELLAALIEDSPFKVGDFVKQRDYHYRVSRFDLSSGSLKMRGQRLLKNGTVGDMTWELWRPEPVTEAEARAAVCK